MKFARFAVCAAVATACVLPASASAAVTSSQVTSPVSGTRYVIDDNATTDAPGNVMTVTGTSNGTTGAEVEIVAGTSQSTLPTILKQHVAVASDGSFSVVVDLSGSTGTPRVLRALPQGIALPVLDVSDLTPFAGPLVLGDSRETHTANGHVDQYEYYRTDSGSVFDVQNTGWRGIELRLFDTTAGTTGDKAWADADELSMSTVTPPGASARAGILIDGAAALMAGNSTIDTSLPGAPDVGFTVEHGTGGDVVIHETAPIVKCVGGCTSYTSSGVQLVHTVRIDGASARARIEDSYQSTDGGSHAVDIEVQQESGSSPEPAWKFPGTSAFAVHAMNDVISSAGWVPGASTIVKLNPAADDATYNSWQHPYAATASSEAPKSGWFDSGYDTFLNLVGTATPAGWNVRTGYSAASTLAAAATSASQLSDWTIAPSVAITSHASGAKVANGALTVKGTATDNVGVTSVTVNGVAATVTGGTWSVKVPVTGAMTLTATAKDAQGNATSAAVNVVGSDKTAPVVRVAKFAKFYGLAAALKLGLPVTFTTTEAGKASAKCTVSAATFKAIGHKTKKPLPVTLCASKIVTIKKAGKAKLVLVFNKAAKKKLASFHKSVKVTVTFTVTDAAGNKTTKTAVATITYVAPKHKH